MSLRGSSLMIMSYTLITYQQVLYLGSLSHFYHFHPSGINFELGGR